MVGHIWGGWAHLRGKGLHGWAMDPLKWVTHRFDGDKAADGAVVLRGDAGQPRDYQLGLESQLPHNIVN